MLESILMAPEVSVIICTHNPDLMILSKVLEALKNQSLLLEKWELIIIDNNSTDAITNQIDLSWQHQSKIIEERKPGLSYARITGVLSANSELIVFVDDDNILEEHYLENSNAHSQEHPNIGCFGGKSLPAFEDTPEAWFFSSGINLGCQDLGNEQYISDYRNVGFKLKEYPMFAPIGTGMLIKKQAFLTYHNEVKNSLDRLALGRKGKALTSGEDNDIILTIIENGYEIGYFPDLVVTHIIPKVRFSLGYLKKMAFESNRSWVKVLHLHHINPWKPIRKISLLPRLMRAYFRSKPWLSKKNEIAWQANFGKLIGLSEIKK